MKPGNDGSCSGFDRHRESVGNIRGRIWNLADLLISPIDAIAIDPGHEAL
jgi:hypothetical protein